MPFEEYRPIKLPAASHNASEASYYRIRLAVRLSELLTSEAKSRAEWKFNDRSYLLHFETSIRTLSAVAPLPPQRVAQMLERRSFLAVHAPRLIIKILRCESHCPRP